MIIVNTLFQVIGIIVINITSYAENEHLGY
jgi:hypothetical protein